MKIIKRIAKIIAVLLLIVAGLALFTWLSGVQYTLAFVTGGFSKPYFDPAGFAASPNCDGAKPCDSGPIKVMSYNVLCRICEKEGYDAWDARVPQLREVIARHNPDLWGSQELGGWDDINEFLALFPQYACVSYEFGPWAYADAALFYRADRFEALDSGQMWLNPKPSLPFGFGWKPLSMPRYVNWVYLRQRSNGFRFLFVNTHFDNNDPNKEPSAVLFAETFRPIAAIMPIVATGDFNTESTTQRYQNIISGNGLRVFVNAMKIAPKTEVINNSTASKDATEMTEKNRLRQIIDHVFLAGPQKNEVTQWVQDASVYGAQERRPSDHPAVCAEVNLHWGG